MRGFRNFLMRGNLVDLAVAVVIGVAFNAVVQAFINDVITPLIAGAAKKPRFDGLKLHLGHTHAVISYGSFLSTVLSFLVTAAVVYYLLVAPTNRITAYTQRNKAATERDCPECLNQIAVGASRCMYCTAAVEPVPQPETKASNDSTLALDRLRRHLL